MVEAGDEGLSLKKIAMHVYNSNNNLFEKPDFNKIYSSIAQYLSKQSKMSDGMVKRIGTKGVYAINKRWSGYLHMMIDFNIADTINLPIDDRVSTIKDQSLSLFDDFE